MEVAAGGAGDPVSDEAPEQQDDRSWLRINLLLVVVLAVCVGAAWVAASYMADQHEEAGGDLSGGFLDDAVSVVLFRDRGADVAPRAGEDVGPGTVEALATAPEDEQERTAAQLEAATKVANAFLNISHDNADAQLETVKTLSTGAFRKQLDKVAGDMARLAEKARATQRTEIVWAGLSFGDTDSARVILAASGTVANKATNFEARARTYRIQADLTLVDDQWLVNDLQFVE